MILTLVEILEDKEGVQSSFHKNIRVRRVTVLYKDQDGRLYQKVFESKEIPVIPESVSEDDLVLIQRQW